MSWLSSFFKPVEGKISGPQQYAYGQIQGLLSPAGKATQYQELLDAMTRARRTGEVTQRRQLARRGIMRGTAGMGGLPEGYLEALLRGKQQVYGGRPDLLSILAGIQQPAGQPSPFSTLLGGATSLGWQPLARGAA